MGRQKGSKNKSKTESVKPQAIKEVLGVSEQVPVISKVIPAQLDATQLMYTFVQALQALNQTIATFSSYKEVVTAHVQLASNFNGLVQHVQELNKKIDSLSVPQAMNAKYATPVFNTKVQDEPKVDNTNCLGAEDPLASI